MDELSLFGAPTPYSKSVDHSQYLETLPSDVSAIQTLLRSEQGYIVGRLGGEFLRLNTDAHLMSISPTGGGKGTGLIIPNLLHHPGSCLVVDIRGETVAKTAMIRRMQGHRVVVIDPFEITEGKYGYDEYNPIDRFIGQRNAKALDDQILRFTKALMFDPSGRMSNEPIWDNATRNLLSGLIGLCVRYWPSYRQNLKEILTVLNYTNKEMDRFVLELQGIIDTDSQARDDQQLKGLLRTLTQSKSTTKITDNALVQAQTLLSWAGNRSFSSAIEKSSFSFQDLQNGRMTVYLVVPEEYVDSCAIWVRLMLESAVFSVPDVYNTRGINTASLRQDQRVLFLLDELPAFGQMDLVSSGMATLRGRGINLWLFVQNLAQLESTYGKEKMRSIIGNVASLQVFESNELEELEYFSRLIGEEFFDVQSVTISQTDTTGTSEAFGKSHAVSNSESFGTTQGTADTVGESSTTNWNKALSKSKNSSLTTSENSSLSGSKNKNSNWSKNKGSTIQYDRNMLWHTRTGDNSNRGKALGGGEGSQGGWQKGNSTSVVEGQGESVSNSLGGGDTSSGSHTDNQSESYVRQQGVTDTDTHTTTTQESVALGRSITVKQERMKIETVRSLREKLSGRNQLLQIRGFQPFFAPRMSYFVKYSDRNMYMFPDLMAMSSKEALQEITSRIGLLKSYDFTVISQRFQESTYYLNAKKHLDIWADGNDVTYVDALKTYRDFLSSGLPSITKDYESIVKDILDQKSCFNEAAKTLLTMIGVMQRMGIEGFENQDMNLIRSMKEMERLSEEKIDLRDDLRRYGDLPLASMVDADFLKEAHFDDETIFNNNMAWLVHAYHEVMKKIIEGLDGQAKTMRALVSQYEATRRLLVSGLELVTQKLDDAIGVAIDRELKMKQSFYLNRYVD